MVRFIPQDTITHTMATAFANSVVPNVNFPPIGCDAEVHAAGLTISEMFNAGFRVYHGTHLFTGLAFALVDHFGHGDYPLTKGVP
jgi:hypothetical protein